MRRGLFWGIGIAIALPLLALAALVALVWIYTPAQPPPPDLPGRVERGRMLHDELERRWTLYVPQNLAKQPALVLILHGSGQDGELTRVLSKWRFDELAERDGAVVAYPEGLANSSAGGAGPEWYECRKATDNRAHRLRVDDVGFLGRLITQLEESHRIDPKRIFAAGISDGGQMAYRLATEMPDRVAAIAAVIAQQAQPHNSLCLEPRGPVSVLVMNGTDDPIIPFEGGEASIRGWFSAGDVQSMDGTLAHWRRVNGILGPARTESLPDVDPADHSRVERETWRAPGGNEVVAYTIRGGGHTLPGGWQYFDPVLIGHTNRDIVAADEIWAFFQRNPLRPPPRFANGKGDAQP